MISKTAFVFVVTRAIVRLETERALKYLEFGIKAAGIVINGAIPQELSGIS